MADGSRGWWSGVDQLRAIGLGEQALKAALAAGLAWALGGLVPGAPPQPYLAPLTAMLTVQLTVAESVTSGLQRTLGAALGVVVALLAGGAMGVNPFTVALLVLVGQAIGALLRLTPIGTSQVMVTALLVLTVGAAATTTFNYGWARIAETIVGALVGVGVNALLVPPSYLPAAAAAKSAVIESLRQELEEIAAGLSLGMTVELSHIYLDRARTVVREFEATRQLVQRAEDSHRFNVRAGSERAKLDAVRSHLEALERSGIQTRTLARALHDAAADSRATWLEPSVAGKPLAELLHTAVRLLDEFLAGGGQSRADADFATRREAVLSRAQGESVTLMPDEWVRLAAILATIERLAADLRGSTHSDEDDETPVSS